MSHVVLKEGETAEQQIRDLDCLWQAVEKCGGLPLKNQTHFRTWATDHGRLAGDYPVPQGYGEADIVKGDCLHAIGLPDGATSGTDAYEIGVVPSKKFPGTFSLLYDFYGGHLDKRFGKGLGQLTTEYRAAAVKKAARYQIGRASCRERV